MKECKKCKEIKPLDQFTNRKGTSDGKQFYCRACMAKAMRTNYENHRDEKAAMNEAVRLRLRDKANDIKAKQGCLLCPEKEICCLDFHHKNPEEKDRTVSEFVGCKSEQRMMDEIAKCVVLCSNCHRKIHAGKLSIAA